MDAEGNQFWLQRHSSAYVHLEKGFKVVDFAVGCDLFHQFCGGLRVASYSTAASVPSVVKPLKTSM